MIVSHHVEPRSGIRQIAAEIARKAKSSVSGPGRFPLWVFPIAVSLLFFQLRGVVVSPDANSYLVWGLNLSQGLGYVDANWDPVTLRGPVFAGMIAGSFWLFGVSVNSALWVVRLFFVLNVGLVYAMGARFFGRATGLVASLLVLTSLSIHRWSSLVLQDNILAFFILLSHLLLFMAFDRNKHPLEKKRPLYFGLAGFSLGVAVLCKPIAWLFLVLPALLWIVIPAYRAGNSWRGLLLFWGAALVLLLPWFVHADSVAGPGSYGTFTQIIDYGKGLVLTPVYTSALDAPAVEGAASSQSAQASVLLHLLSKIWSWLGNYYRGHFEYRFALAPLILLAWGYVAFRAIRFRQARAEKLLVISLLLFSPLMLWMGTINAPDRYSFHLWLMSCLVLARLLWPVGGTINIPGTLTKSGVTRFLVAGLLLVVPFVVLMATIGPPVGSSLFVWLLCYLVVARLLWPVVGNIRLPQPRVRPGLPGGPAAERIRSLINDCSVPRTLGVISVTAAIAIQIWVGQQGLIRLVKDADAQGYVPGLKVYAPSLGRGGWELRGFHSKLIVDAARWLAENSAPGEMILTEGMWHNTFYFYLNARQPTYQPDYVYHQLPYPNVQAGPVLFLHTYDDRTDINGQILALTEPRLLSQINELNIKYVAVLPHHNLLSLYFMDHPDFDEVKRFEEGAARIFKTRDEVLPIASFSPHEFEMHVGKGVAGFLENLREQMPARYDYVSGRLQDNLGFSAAEIERLESWEGPTIEHNRVYGIDDYVKLAREQGPQAMQNAIALQEQKAALYPHNPRPYFRLAHLHMARGDIEGALAAYQQAVAASPNDEEAVRRSMVEAYIAAAVVSEKAQAYRPGAVVAWDHFVGMVPPDASGYAVLGHLYQGQGETEQAFFMYYRALALEPDQQTKADIYVLLGQLYEAQGDPEAAILHFQRAVEADRSSADRHSRLAPDVVRQAQVLTRLAEHYAQQGNLESAMGQLEEALELLPGDEAIAARLDELRRQYAIEHPLTVGAGELALKPQGWVRIYLLQLLLLSLALGSWTLHLPRWLRVPRMSRFLIGCCATPFVMGAWMLLMAAIVPGGRRLLFLAPPLAVAVALLVFYGPRALRRLIRDHRRTLRASRNPWPVYAVYAGVAVMLVVLVPKLVQNGRPPTLAHDASIYLSQALPFAQERSLGATSGWLGAPGDANQGSNHNFVYPAFLSHALLNTGHNPLGYPYDHAARAAFQATFICMLLSVVALASTTRYLGAGALAVILLLQVPQIEYISYQSSRDAFRIIPLMLLAATLAGVSPPKLRYRLRPAALVKLLLPPMVLAAFSLSGHTLGGLVVVTMALAWLIWGLLRKARWLNMTLVLVAMGVGLLLGGFHYLVTYLETGTSGITFTRQTMQRRLLEEPGGLSERIHEAVSMTTPQRLATLLKRDQYRLSIAGLVGAVLAIAGWARSQRSRRAQAIPFIGLMVLTGSLPFLGVFDIGYYFSAGFIANERYLLHWYPFAAVCVATLVVWGYNVFVHHYSERFSAWFNKAVVNSGSQLRRGFVRLISGKGVAAWTVLHNRLRIRRREPSTTRHVSTPLPGIWYGTSTKEAISPGEISPAVKGARWVGAGAVIAALALVLVICLATSSAYSVVSSADWTTVDSEQTVASLRQQVEPLLRVVPALPADQRLLLEDDRYNYYLRNQAIAMGTPSTRNVLGAESENEVQVALKELNVNAVALDQESISSGRWYQSFLFNFLNDLDNAVLIMSDRQSLVYRIVEDDAARKRLIEASAEKLGDHTPASYLINLIRAGYLDFHYDSFSLPFNWQGSDTIGMEDLTQTAPLLADVGHSGDFTFTRMPGENGDVIRVSPVPGEGTDVGWLEFGLLFHDDGNGLEFHGYSPENEEDEVEIRPREFVILSLWVRMSAPPERGRLFIQDRTDEWQRSNVVINSTSWQRYEVFKEIRQGATDAIIGVQWRPKTEGDWLEIRDMRVLVATPLAVEWLKQGWTHYEQREYEQAISAFEQAVALDEATNIEGWAGKGLSHLALGQYSEGVGILAPVMAAPVDLTPDQLALVYTALESAYCQRGLTAECKWIHQHIDAYLRAAESNMLPSFVMQLMNLGYVDSHYPSYSLPFNWLGADTVGLKDLTQTAPPLMDTGHRGDFTFSHTSAEDGDVIRVSSVTAAEGNLRQIQFGVSFQDQGSGLEFYEYSPEDKQDEIEIGDGHIVILSLWARISSPSEVDSVFIQDKTDNWERSKTPIMSTAWQQYVVARVIRDEATDVTIGVVWAPKTGDEWLEIRDMRVFVDPSQSPSQP